ncbi:hypothetical protein [Rickettsiales endosymbiont of Stachyamoeba lipophora]|uniref:hypothetical protein n=1 Tax=Rickettsiales endosymbiont of Stachyamoeba lipophora TaxID=2486578 RepID=UPI000F654CE7|nr:hypothetical protein [Rickettsiales endosymbiont of Stachyamoeba lipophora]AZL15328.1 hypothetical protein EF513_01990 [Rickettsiales endosymbiont of Stachyamoeba lipophora]
MQILGGARFYESSNKIKLIKQDGGRLIKPGEYFTKILDFIKKAFDMDEEHFKRFLSEQDGLFIGIMSLF